MKKNVLAYKGYLAELQLDIDDDIIIGKIIGTSDIISFHGKTIKEAEIAFKNVLDSYLEICKEKNIKPSKPYSGRFNLRIKPELHRNLSIEAIKSNMSLNYAYTMLHICYNHIAVI